MSMKIVFISNYMNHHQIPFCEACRKLLGENFSFIQTEPMEEERIQMGWQAESAKLTFVHCFYEEKEVCTALLNQCDIALIGWTENRELVEFWLKSGKPTIRISERIYREGQWKAISPRGLIQKYREHIRYRNRQHYLLCAGAYVASDFQLIGAYPGKKFRFGYFPETRIYEKGELEGKKGDLSTVHILWAGRFLPLKHPEYALRLALALRNENVSFHLHMIGSGEMERELKEFAEHSSLLSDVTFYGFQTPEEVRHRMEQSDLFLFTSNHLEGWGAVVNEAMNSGCAVVASREAGAVPYLIQDGVNGLIYEKDSYEILEVKVKRLLSEKKMIRQYGKKAYETIISLWNADCGAKRLVAFCEGIRTGGIEPPAEGPLSIAPVIRPEHFKS